MIPITLSNTISTLPTVPFITKCGDILRLYYQDTHGYVSYIKLHNGRNCGVEYNNIQDAIDDFEIGESVIDAKIII